MKQTTDQLYEYTKTLPFQLGFFAKRLSDGYSIGHNQQTRFPAASVIKLPLLFTALKQVDDGKLHLHQRVQMQQEDLASGSGVLQTLDAGLNPSLKDILTLMIIVSDNTATNLCLDAITSNDTPGFEILNNQMQSWGFLNTQAVGKLQVPWQKKTEAQKNGAVAKTNCQDCIDMLEQLHNGTLLSAASTELALHTLGQQQYTEMIGRHLPEGTRIATKSGQIVGTRNDVGLVWAGQTPYAVAFFTEGVKDERHSVDNEAVLAVAKLSKMIFELMQQ